MHYKNFKNIYYKEDNRIRVQNGKQQIYHSVYINNAMQIIKYARVRKKGKSKAKASI